MHNKMILVVPCFNEENRFPFGYWQELIRADSNLGWVFVNDGSTDSTNTLLNQVVIDSNSIVIDYSKNLGKGNAIRKGFLTALDKYPDCEFLGYIDSDGAFSKDDVLHLMNKTFDIPSSEINGPLDAVLSSRVALAGRNIRRKSSRHYVGRIVATFLTSSWKEGPYDTQSGFKIFRNSKSFQHALENDFKSSWFIDIELLTRIGNLNGGLLNIWEEPLTSWRDVSGSKINVRKIPKLIIEILMARREVTRYLKMRGV
ncbi:WcaA Glycosyltransferases involved in cell wall biogenesis [Candidatus Nanopelagicaceae bacterium]